MKLIINGRSIDFTFPVSRETVSVHADGLRLNAGRPASILLGAPDIRSVLDLAAFILTCWRVRQSTVHGVDLLTMVYDPETSYLEKCMRVMVGRLVIGYPATTATAL